MTVNSPNYCPTLSQWGLVKIYTALDGNLPVYQSDISYFRYTAKGKRRCAIRLRSDEEFSEPLRAVILFVVVVQIAPGMHIVLPIYRGKPDFFSILKDTGYADVTSDAEVFRIVEECHRRGGIDLAQWNRFIDQLNNPPVHNGPAWAQP